MTTPLQIHLFPCLIDNYGFLIHSPETGETACVDTPDADTIRQACDAKGWSLTEIWNTHHHFDHVGGNLALKAQFGVTIRGSEQDRSRIPGLDYGLSDGGSFSFAGHKVHVLETPGHTIGHIAYYIPSAKAAFVGDTLFALGCGRLFEGTPEQMFQSLARLSALPEETALYCAHEYTLSNGRFALTVEADNPALQAYMRKATEKRDKGQPTVPTYVQAEKQANPFVRAANAQQLGQIRQAKDRFKG